MQALRTCMTLLIIGSISQVSYGNIITGFIDREEWEGAVGDFATITFTEFPQGTIITDQYAGLGVLFTDGNDYISHSSAFVNDGAGLRGSFDLQVTVEFETSQLWVGIDHPGTAALDIYYNGQLLGSFENVSGIFGAFTGIISNSLFDKVVIYRPTGTEPLIDDLHWGVPAPGAVGVFTLALLCGGSRRRRRPRPVARRVGTMYGLRRLPGRLQL